MHLDCMAFYPSDHDVLTSSRKDQSDSVGMTKLNKTTTATEHI